MSIRKRLKIEIIMNSKLIEVKNLYKSFPVKKGFFARSKDAVRAVRGVSFYIDKGETFGVVGESGCGKSTVAMLLLRLLEPDAGEFGLREIILQICLREL